MCDPIAPPVTVCHTVKIRLLFCFFLKVDDAGGKYLSDTSTSAGVKSTVIRTSVNIFESSKSDKPNTQCVSKGTGRLVREQIGNVEARMQDSMVLHAQLRIIFDEDPGQHSAVLCARENDGC